jgi:hypothetical protein
VCSLFTANNAKSSFSWLNRLTSLLFGGKVEQLTCQSNTTYKRSSLLIYYNKVSSIIILYPGLLDLLKLQNLFHIIYPITKEIDETR